MINTLFEIRKRLKNAKDKWGKKILKDVFIEAPAMSETEDVLPKAFISLVSSKIEPALRTKFFSQDLKINIDIIFPYSKIEYKKNLELFQQIMNSLEKNEDDVVDFSFAGFVKIYRGYDFSIEIQQSFMIFNVDLEILAQDFKAGNR